VTLSKHTKGQWTAIILVILTLTLVPASRKLLFEGHFFSFVDAQATERGWVSSLSQVKDDSWD